MSVREAEGSVVGGDRAAVHPALVRAAANQPRAAAVLGAALGHGPVHAYLLHGPRGSGKRQVARAFAAEILAQGAREVSGGAEEARRRALLDPSPHPDLVWLVPDGAQYRVEEIRERLIGAAYRSAFEGGRRVFVVEAAEAMRQESQNALLKTLEEPPVHTHILLVTDRPEGLEPTILSRCQSAGFRPLAPEVVEAELREGDPARTEAERRALARLSAGDLERARLLGSEVGAALRREAERYVTAAADPASITDAERPWSGLVEATERSASDAEGAAEERLEAEADLAGRRSKAEGGQLVRREARRARLETLGLGLELAAIWLRDLVAIAAGAEELVHNVDRLETLREQAGSIDAASARRAAELVTTWRRRLTLNVSEELALEALHSRLRRELT